MTEPSATPPAPPPSAGPPPAALPRRFESRHAGRFHGVEVAYRCLAGETQLNDDDGKPRALVFSFSYLAEQAGAQPVDAASRPVTFMFNGGPGSASLWLHMGVFGPRRIVLPGDASHPGGAPYTVADNELCNLDLTDIVFIDPPGTGYSRMAGGVAPEEAWGLEADAQLVADFIKAWLTAHRRWAAPRFLCGESYGTTRAVAVAGKLSGGLAGVAFNGIGLISVILDFHTARFQTGNPLPDACFLPTYAATALHHGLVAAPQGGRDAFLREVRQFATAEYLPALFAGNRLDGEARARVRRKLARYTGLSEAWLERTRLRIEAGRFRKEMLRERGLTVGRFDSRYTGADFDDVGEQPDSDPSSYAIDSAFVSAMNDHLTRALAVDWDRPYTVFNRTALEKWDWHDGRKGQPTGWPGYVNVAPVLGQLLRENPSLRVLMANGLYDIATPFFAVESTIAGNGIDAARVRMTYHEAGHMMYLHEPSFAALVDDLRGLIAG
ncbi:MAG: peptidase S10 [Rhodospirillales bacterium 70-18]|nr:peptidase S10 [Rhodospirillales bacterium]OJY64809.1 MAG: peptidase S10 [Rhodospirillales bacterium 70-18]